MVREVQKCKVAMVFFGGFVLPAADRLRLLRAKCKAAHL